MVGSPFILIPAAPSPASTSALPSSLPAPASAPAPNSSTPPQGVKRAVAFKPPAHIHARHIHSIQRSPNNTRTLILEETLSHFADIRLAAARALLGFGGITNQLGPESIRHRHEFYKGFTYTPNAQSSNAKKDEQLAARLDSKAKGISNVLCAMLAQEPAHGVASRSHEQLPNDVRFRLVLAILLEHYFTPSSPEPSSSKEKKPEIPLELAPFVSLSSYQASSPSAITRPSNPTLPSLKSLNLASTSPAKGPQSPFTAFSATGVSPRPVKPLFLLAGSSGISNAPPTPRPIMNPSPAVINSGSEKEPALPTPVPVYKWPSQERSSTSKDNNDLSSLNPDVASSRRAQIPKTMTTSFNWLPPTPNTAEKEKSNAAVWDQGLTLQLDSDPSSSYCIWHLRQGCEAHTCTPSFLPRSERSSIGAGLDSRRSQLEIFSDATEDEENRTRMLNVLTGFIRLSALISSSPPRKEWYGLLASILTRAVLEGYLLHGWRGNRAVQVLFGFGGQNARLSPCRNIRSSDSDSDDSESDEEDEESEFSPDGYLKLEDAYRKLFVASTSHTTSTIQSEESQDFRNEMSRRRSEFISPTEMPAGGLKAHLNALNERYSAEELDKKMVEFVECISLWKGASTLERARSEVSQDTMKLSTYFTASTSIKTMDVDGSDISSSGSQSEDEHPQEERTSTARPPTPASSKRPRTPSLSDPQEQADGTTPSPPLKRERISIIA